MSRSVFVGAAVFDGAELRADAAVVVEHGRVAAVLPASGAPDGGTVRLEGGILAPGFVDLHRHGQDDENYRYAAMDGVTDPAERLRRIAHLHLGRLGRDKHLAVVFQVELRQSVKFMERFSATFLQDYLKLIRDAIADGQAGGAFRRDISATTATKMFFGALDEMATNWMLSRRKYDPTAEADAVVDLFINGVGTQVKR